MIENNNINVIIIKRIKNIIKNRKFIYHLVWVHLVVHLRLNWNFVNESLKQADDVGHQCSELFPL